MIKTYTNSDDPEFNDTLSRGPKWKRQPNRATTWILTCVALVSVVWGVASLVSLIRRERSLAKANAYPYMFKTSPILSGAKLDAEHFERVRLGMTFGDVVSLLGGPPGLYDGVIVVQYSGDERLDPGKGSYPGVQKWINRTACFNIRFDKDDHVIDKEYCPVRGLLKSEYPW